MLIWIFLGLITACGDEKELSCEDQCEADYDTCAAEVMDETDCEPARNSCLETCDEQSEEQ